MPEYIMQYDLDENGKLINASRREELVRCRDCIFCYRDNQFNLCWCNENCVKPDGYCNAGRRSDDT